MLNKILLNILYLQILAFVLFFLIEILHPGFISNSFDLNILLIVILVWSIVYFIIKTIKK